MPVYEYECEDCGKQFEAFQSISDKPLKSCKFCQGTVRRLISQSSFALKGSGWYRDGYVKTSPEAKKPPGETGKSGKTGKTPDKPDKKAKTAS